LSKFKAGRSGTFEFQIRWDVEPKNAVILLTSSSSGGDNRSKITSKLIPDTAASESGICSDNKTDQWEEGRVQSWPVQLLGAEIGCCINNL